MLVTCAALAVALAFGPDPPVECSNCVGSDACRKAASVVFPKDVKIPNSAFEGCTNLVAVEIPSGVQFIGSQAFQGCTNLSAVKIPGTISQIGGNAFYGCTSLAKVSFASSIYMPRIYTGTFQKCSSLNHVALPANLHQIDAYAFDGCSSLSSISIPASVDTVFEHAFDEAACGPYLYYPGADLCNCQPCRR
jgi:hypothetical protein